jgi:hypothetical protein
MRRFRILLTMLLCLTVPVSGWASVLGAPFCPRGEHRHGATAEAAAHEHGSSSSHATKHDHDARLTATAHIDARHARHCSGDADHGKPCKGQDCACGCAVGACSAPSLSLLASMPSAVFARGGEQAIPDAASRRHADTRGASLLRPPIS